MTLSEFRTLVDTWGADIDRWPEAKRAAARGLVASAEAAAILVEARRLDQLLARRPEVSDERARTAAHAVTLRLAAAATPRESWWSALLRNEWIVPAASLACSALLGASLAVSLPSASGEADQTVALGMILDSTSLMGGLEVR